MVQDSVREPGLAVGQSCAAVLARIEGRHGGHSAGGRQRWGSAIR